MSDDTTDRYLYLECQVAAAEEAIAEAQDLIAEKRGDIKLLKRWMKQLEKGVCQSCGGRGEILRHLAQDEAKYFKCKDCKGTGRVTDPTSDKP